MRLRTIKDAEEFIKLIKTCKDPVYLTDWELDANGDYNFRINLKSTLSMYVGVVQLLSEHGDWFELHTSNKEDEEKIMQFMNQLKLYERE